MKNILFNFRATHSEWEREREHYVILQLIIFFYYYAEGKTNIKTLFMYDFYIQYTKITISNKKFGSWQQI